MKADKNALVIGGTRGIGLASALELAERNYHVYILGRTSPNIENIPLQRRGVFQTYVHFVAADLSQPFQNVLDGLPRMDYLLIAAGFGRVAPFEALTCAEIQKLVQVNETAAIQMVHYYYNQICGEAPFYCAIVSSIAGMLSSPLFSVYGAAKGALCRLIESLNAELSANNRTNRILNVAPGYIEGTGFYGGDTELDRLNSLTKEILSRMEKRETLYIPNYEETYCEVLSRYAKDPIQFGIDSFHYKQASRRNNVSGQATVGYMSGTFDLFHIGHLNLIRRAKAMCDYLVVGIHRDGARKGKETFIPFNERMEIIRSISYVDEVIAAPEEDCDVYSQIPYDYLFVGSDYKGSERFLRYEKMFAKTKTKIVYFPYTTGTSSTQLREALDKLR
ncbi:SDR family NAD(P)-dependent oxidoreductase [Pseudoflavonifractor phocaeensis]|uniref:SDR family NAD(P)-dependent oxidoreductase n=1 Tax=Pseudoflavonifractor phocaeensis TaxID=1870988 RepID=UPI00195765FB|nr:SDR family NAD(P)-dependent oxidoreductase [Pseudoflavonifractor phocaeensis]MBM6721509.1 SDR family NAD(P)-dependent oxidoreductase [Pseudoflavonifractor phocaeensis]